MPRHSLPTFRNAFAPAQEAVSFVVSLLDDDWDVLVDDDKAFIVARCRKGERIIHQFNVDDDDAPEYRL